MEGVGLKTTGALPARLVHSTHRSSHGKHRPLVSVAEKNNLGASGFLVAARARGGVGVGGSARAASVDDPRKNTSHAKKIAVSNPIRSSSQIDRQIHY
jgi:hypothetical protein